MKKMKMVYIAGPYRSGNSWELEANVRVAEAASFQVFSLGAVAICPHSISRYMMGTLNEEFWIEATMNMLSRCDAMIVVQGWEESDGTLGEIDYAWGNNIPVFFNLEDFIDWMAGGVKEQSRCQPKSVKDGP